MSGGDFFKKKFGRLTVLNKTSKKNSSGSYFWKCLCDCGNETLALPKDLKSGHKTSCGCYRYERVRESKMLQLQGEKFGRLTVIKETDRRKKSDGKIIWLCKCECGNEVFANGPDLIKGNVISCGCYHNDNVIPILNEFRTENLVENTKLDNLTQKISKNNKTGVKGVWYDKKSDRYQAYITFQQKRINLGTYKTLGEAAKVRKEAEEKYFKPIVKKYKKE